MDLGNSLSRLQEKLEFDEHKTYKASFWSTFTFSLLATTYMDFQGNPSILGDTIFFTAGIIFFIFALIYRKE